MRVVLLEMRVLVTMDGGLVVGRGRRRRVVETPKARA
jgi:hypothetical protein